MAGIDQLGSSAAACCVAGALALHAVVAGVALSPTHERRVLRPADRGGVLHTRLLSADKHSAPSTSSRPNQWGADHIAAAPLPTPTPTPTIAAPTEDAFVPPPSLASGVLAVNDPAPPPPPSAAPLLNDYLPRALLTQAPSASQPILLDFPAELPDDQRLRIVLRLYVDETGVVRRVARVGGDSQEQAQAIAEQAFLQARFHPGEVEGYPVKSIIHVEVTFDSTSPDPAR